MHDSQPPAHYAKAPDVLPRHAQEILDFWFGDTLGPKRWFNGGKALDDEIKRKFSHAIADAEAGKLDRWAETPRGALALLILCDQFTRNMFRGKGRAFELDKKALEIAAVAHARGFDRDVPFSQRGFFYLPFEHDESLVSQIASVMLFEVLRRDAKGTADEGLCEQQYSYAIRHRDAILRFGRFPARNAALGRASTDKEAAYLKEHAEGF